MGNQILLKIERFISNSAGGLAAVSLIICPPVICYQTIWQLNMHWGLLRILWQKYLEYLEDQCHSNIWANIFGAIPTLHKDRFSLSFSKPQRRSRSRMCLALLSAHIWELKDKGKDYDVEWDFIDRAPSFNPITRKCRLCLKEKYHIMYSKEGSTLNKRHKKFKTCRHRKQKLLQYVKTWVNWYFFILV